MTENEKMLHLHGVSLIKLAPLGYSDISDERHYYKIFGGKSVASSVYELSCFTDWIRNPEKTSIASEVYNALHLDFNLMVSALDRSAQNEAEFQTSMADSLRVLSIENYANSVGWTPIDSASLRRRFQGFIALCDNLCSGRILCQSEHEERVELE